MAGIVGTSDNSRLRVTGFGANARDDFGVDTDPFKIMPEIVKRAGYQANLRYGLEQPKAAPAPVQQVAINRAYDNPISYSGGKESAPRMQAAALQSPRAQKFVKMLNIAGSFGGYIPAQAWEPGAIAAGELPEGVQGFAPTSASFGGNADRGRGEPGPASLDSYGPPSGGGGGGGGTGNEFERQRMWAALQRSNASGGARPPAGAGYR